MGGAVYGELLDFFQLQTQAADGVFGLFQLFLGGGALHGQNLAAHLHIGGRQLQQDVQPGHGTAGGVIVLLPAGGYGFLCPGGDAFGLYPQLRQEAFQPVHPLAQAVQQGQLHFRTGDLHRHTGETGAAAHINELLALEVFQGQQGDAVQKVQSCHFFRLGNGRQVHHLILLHHCLTEITQLLTGFLV